MSAQGRATRSRIMAAARHFFWYDGYNLTTISKILASARANSGSFYRFFTTKESVLLAVLADNASSFVPNVVTPAFQKVSHPVERVFEILNHYREDLIKSKFGRGCLLGKLAFEIPETYPHIHQRIALGFDHWTTTVAKCLEGARELLPHKTDLKALSTFVLAVMEGAIAQARAHQSIAPFDNAVQHLLHYFALLSVQREWEEQQNGLLETQNARQPARAQNKRNAPSPDGTAKNAKSFPPIRVH